MNENASVLLVNVGAPFLIGVAVVYFTKKALKVGLFLLGLSIVALFIFAHYGWIELSGPNLTQAVEKGTDAVNQLGSFLMESLSGLGGVGLGGGAGFFVGLKMG